MPKTEYDLNDADALPETTNEGKYKKTMVSKKPISVFAHVGKSIDDVSAQHVNLTIILTSPVLLLHLFTDMSERIYSDQKKIL